MYNLEHVLVSGAELTGFGLTVVRLQELTNLASLDIPTTPV